MGFACARDCRIFTICLPRRVIGVWYLYIKKLLELPKINEKPLFMPGSISINPWSLGNGALFATTCKSSRLATKTKTKKHSRIKIESMNRLYYIQWLDLLSFMAFIMTYHSRCPPWHPFYITIQPHNLKVYKSLWIMRNHSELLYAHITLNIPDDVAVDIIYNWLHSDLW